MNFAAQRRLDYVVGEPLCGLLNAWVRALGFLLKRDHSLAPGFRRIWVMKFVGLGSLVNATPLLRSMRATYSQAEFTLIGFPGMRLLGERLPQVDRVLTVRNSGMMALAWDCLLLLFRAWRERPELVVDLEVHSRFSTLVSVLTMARNRAGFYHSTALFREGMYTHLMFYNRLKHTVDCYLQLGRALGCSDADAALENRLVTAEETEEAEQFLQEAGIADASRLIAVNPNAGPLCDERKWPAASFARLIGELAARGQWNFVLVGSPEEQPANEEVLAGVPAAVRSRVLNAAGALSFGGTVGLLSRARLLIANDSGLLHFAVAVGAPTVSLWGPCWPGAYAPRGEGHRVVYGPIYCSPCLYMVDAPPCAGDNLCMQQIGWPEVLAAALELLQGPQPDLPREGHLLLQSDYLPGYLRRKSVPLSPATE